MRVAGVTLLAALALGTALPAREPTKQELLVAIEKQLKATAEGAGPCVGCVVVSRSDRYPKVPGADDQPGRLGGYDFKEFIKLNPAPGDARLGVSLDLSDPKNIPDHGYACGVVIDPSGLVLTPYHVVEGATKVYVHLPGKVGSYADVHAADARHDLAVLKLLTPPARLTAIKFADVRVDARRNGQRPTVVAGNLAVLMANVYVTGFVIDRPSAALGSVTNVRFPHTREIDPRAMKDVDKPSSYYHYGPLIEYDAKLNTGVDGAALLNLDGELVGLATSSAVLGDRGASYAFPADANFRRVLDVLRRGAEVDYGYLGVSLPRDSENLQITDVVPLGPADQAGIQGSPQRGLADVITHVNDVPIGSYEELLQQVGGALAGNTVKLTVARGGRGRDVEVTLGKYVHRQPHIASVRPEPVFGLRVDYGSVLAQTTSRTPDGVPPGVCVREVAPNSPAATAFKKLGDDPKRWLVTHVNGTAVSTPAEFNKAAKGQQSVKLTVKDPSDPNSRDREVSLP